MIQGSPLLWSTRHIAWRLEEDGVLKLAYSASTAVANLRILVEKLGIYVKFERQMSRLLTFQFGLT